MSNVLLAVDHRENARLLRLYLDHHYSVVFPTNEHLETPFDLGIFDGHALSRFWQEIQLYKHAEQHLFMPILLVTPRKDIKMITRQLWQSIDEIIFVPIEKSEFLVRIEVLLRARRLSLELQRKNLQLGDEIASHKETGQALQESDERFRAALKNSPVVVARTDRELRYTWIYNMPGGLAPEMMGKRDDEISEFDNVEVMMQLKRAALETGVGVRQEIEAYISGVYKAYDVSVEPIKEDDVIVGLRIASYDITERKRAEQRVLMLYNLTAELSKSLTVEQVAETIIEYSLSALGATAGSVVMLGTYPNTLEIIKSVGYEDDVDDQWQSFSLDLTTAPLAVAINTNTPLLFDSVKEWMESGFYDASLPGESKHKAWAALPFSVEGRVIGGLGLSFPSAKVFDAAERGLMTTLAHQCAQALERVSLSERLKEAAVIAERHRLARDLHDAVSQTLFAASITADSMPSVWEKNPDKGRDMLKHVTVLNRGALAEMRTLLLELRPEAIVKTSFKTLLMQLIEAIKGKKIIEAELISTGDEIRLPEDIHVTLYRIVQEALNNVMKHSGATKLCIALEYTPEQVLLQITDNGHGFDPSQISSGLGLQGMRERAELIGLRLAVSSVPDEGTEIRVFWDRDA